MSLGTWQASWLILWVFFQHCLQRLWESKALQCKDNASLFPGTPKESESKGLFVSPTENPQEIPASATPVRSHCAVRSDCAQASFERGSNSYKKINERMPFAVAGDQVHTPCALTCRLGTCLRPQCPGSFSSELLASGLKGMIATSYC